nr:immunoglobulin heavy chain junction region [Mus musculus]
CARWDYGSSYVLYAMDYW